MVKLLCHSIRQEAELYKIVPTKLDVTEEYVIYLPQCVMCEQPILEILRLDINGEFLEPIRLKTGNIPQFLRSMNVLWKPKKINYQQQRGKHFLNYNAYGTKQKCWGKLSAIRLGAIEIDPYIDLQHFKKSA